MSGEIIPTNKRKELQDILDRVYYENNTFPKNHIKIRNPTSNEVYLVRFETRGNGLNIKKETVDGKIATDMIYDVTSKNLLILPHDGNLNQDTLMKILEMYISSNEKIRRDSIDTFKKTQVQKYTQEIQLPSTIQYALQYTQIQTKEYSDFSSNMSRKHHRNLLKIGMISLTVPALMLLLGVANVANPSNYAKRTAYASATMIGTAASEIKEDPETILRREVESNIQSYSDSLSQLEKTIYSLSRAKAPAFPKPHIEADISAKLDTLMSGLKARYRTYKDLPKELQGEYRGLSNTEFHNIFYSRMYDTFTNAIIFWDTIEEAMDAHYNDGVKKDITFYLAEALRETEWRYPAVSYAGAVGYSQTMSDTAGQYSNINIDGEYETILTQYLSKEIRKTRSWSMDNGVTALLKTVLELERRRKIVINEEQLLSLDNRLEHDTGFDLLASEIAWRTEVYKGNLFEVASSYVGGTNRSPETKRYADFIIGTKKVLDRFWGEFESMNDHVTSETRILMYQRRIKELSDYLNTTLHINRIANNPATYREFIAYHRGISESLRSIMKTAQDYPSIIEADSEVIMLKTRLETDINGLMGKGFIDRL